MTKRILSIVALAMLVAIVPLSITTSASEVSCRIPFSFIVSGKTMSPGFYTVSSGHGYMVIKGLRGAAIALTSQTNDRTGGHARFVFLKTGESYELAEVWSGDGSGLQVPPSKHRADSRLASNAPAEQVVILANVVTGTR
jgi:hypothetical protein